MLMTCWHAFTHSACIETSTDPTMERIFYESSVSLSQIVVDRVAIQRAKIKTSCCKQQITQTNNLFYKRGQYNCLLVIFVWQCPKKWVRVIFLITVILQWKVDLLHNFIRRLTWIPFPLFISVFVISLFFFGSFLFIAISLYPSGHFGSNDDLLLWSDKILMCATFSLIMFCFFYRSVSLIFPFVSLCCPMLFKRNYMLEKKGGKPVIVFSWDKTANWNVLPIALVTVVSTILFLSCPFIAWGLHYYFILLSHFFARNEDENIVTLSACECACLCVCGYELLSSRIIDITISIDIFCFISKSSQYVYLSVETDNKWLCGKWRIRLIWSVPLVSALFTRLHTSNVVYSYHLTWLKLYCLLQLKQILLRYWFQLKVKWKRDCFLEMLRQKERKALNRSYLPEKRSFKIRNDHLRF